MMSLVRCRRAALLGCLAGVGASALGCGGSDAECGAESRCGGTTSGPSGSGGGGGGGATSAGGGGAGSSTGGGAATSTGAGGEGGSPEPIDPLDFCAEIYGAAKPASPNFAAFGFTRSDKTLQELWGISAGEASTTRVGLPGFHLDPSAQRYLAIPFTMTDDSGGALSQFTIDWIEAHPSMGLETGRVAVTISPCPGDFRPSTGLDNPDPYLTFKCRPSSAKINANLTVNAVAGSATGCPAPKGKLMFINIATYDMFDPTAPSMTTCNGASTCGVSVVIQ